MRVALLVIAGAVTLAASVANAADVPQALPPPICVPRAQANLWPGVPICVEEFSGWYLRGDIGITNQRVKKLENALLPPSTNHVNAEFDSAGLFGVGVGYQFNNWLRVDVTGEYRSNSDFAGLDIIHGGGANPYTDEYRAKKSEWLFLANAYLDLGTWWCVTPFVGAGIGASRVNISSFVDVNTPTGGVAFAPSDSKWNLAWALHAGLAFQATNNLAIELAYRYTDLGDGRVGDAVTYNGINNFNNPTTFKNITSHDVKLGLRWTCCDTEPAPPPPPVYAPPIMRKG
jgi:opacity protein-like surface antigen